jgi:hypothetical protein
MRPHLATVLFVVVAAMGCKKESKDSGTEPTPAKGSADAAAAVVKAKAPDAAPVAATPDAAPAPAATDPHAAALAALATAAKCEDPASPERVWCIAADGWAAAASATLPAGAATLAGLTVELVDGKSVDQALSDAVSVSALALKQDGATQRAKLTNVVPSNEDEKMMMFEAVASLAILYKGKADVAELPKDLAEYFASLADGAEYEVTAAGIGWTWSGTSTAELRKVGDYWVVIEVPEAKNGRWVSIFTDKIKSK